VCGDNIKIDLKETDVRLGLDLRGLGEGHMACLSNVTNSLVPQDARYFLRELRTSLHQETFCSVGLEKYCFVVV